MPVASATAERSFSVLRRLKTYARSTMKNDRLSSLGLMHIQWDFEVDLYTAMEVFVSTKTRRKILDNFKKFLSIKVIKIVLDSMLFETLKWPQIAPFCISSKQITDPLPFSRIMACTLLSLSYAPSGFIWNRIVKNYSDQILFARLCIIIIIHVFIVSIKGPRRGRELHIKQILIQCTYIMYNNTTFLCRTESETK